MEEELKPIVDPTLEVIRFTTRDIISVSGGLPDPDEEPEYVYDDENNDTPYIPKP